MSNFSDQMQADAAAVVNADEFGTTISVTPHGSSPRSIVTVVAYDVPNVIPESGKTITLACVIEIQNHATLGMTAINKNGDVFTFPDKISGTNRAWRVFEVLAQDSAMFRLSLR